MAAVSDQQLNILAHALEGDLFYDQTHRRLYATDASVFRVLPRAVVFPRGEADVVHLVRFARSAGISLIPRGGGTSLAGQVVGRGIVVDTSRYMNRILEVDTNGRRARVEPGVIRDTLNHRIQPAGLFFAPETSTSDRCTLGGMVGNNACGLHSLRYGSTREHVSGVKAVLADGSIARLTITRDRELRALQREPNELGRILRGLSRMLGDPDVRGEIRDHFPHAEITRRNTGYALDLMAAARPFNSDGEPFNLCRLICGSEGTLVFVTEIELSLTPMPPPFHALMAIHLEKREDAYMANLEALRHDPEAVEMMDRQVLALSARSPGQRDNRFFLRGDPGAVLMVEFAGMNDAELNHSCAELEKNLRSTGLGFHFPVLKGDQIARAWDLRRGGLGVLSRMDGTLRPVSVIEDTAVRVEDLPAFMAEVEELLRKRDLECVVHAHVGTGELHLRPLLDLHQKAEARRFQEVGMAVACLVKRYRGSLSGEHGDGRLRAAWIPLVLGEVNTALLKRVKKLFDPAGIFNPGKIVDAPPVTQDLRAAPGKEIPIVETVFDFSQEGGILGAAERCSGSADCRRERGGPGTMCPSYRATRDEIDSTRGRANLLRECIMNPRKKIHPLDHPELAQAMDLCLACKSCRNECPSGVDMTRMKAEVLQRRHDREGISTRYRLVAGFPALMRLGMAWPGLVNRLLMRGFLSAGIRRILGFTPRRAFPRLPLRRERRRLFRAFGPSLGSESRGEVVFLLDEFSSIQDAPAARAAVTLLRKLGYGVISSGLLTSGRTYLSTGMLRSARALAGRNVSRLAAMLTGNRVLVGMEPSALLSFRDEYPDLLSGSEKQAALRLGERSLLVEEFLCREIDAGRITSSQFTKRPRRIMYHGHCHQKALAGTETALRCLSVPEHFQVEEVDSGCCGMAGMFGYEAEHFEISMRIGEESLFPAIRDAGGDVEIVACGTSCRQQILDGTGRRARHLAEVLYEALVK